MAQQGRLFDSARQRGPDLTFERRYARFGRVCGVDEAGRGPWAGPVAVAAVVLDLAGGEVPADLTGLDDSKKLSAATRERLYEAICARHHVALVFASVDRIDRSDIRAATLWAMREAVAGLPVTPGFVLVDGVDVPEGLACPGEAVKQGDGRALSIAAASVVAKVARDRLMVRLGECYPGYGFERHKGYGAAAHKAALDRMGPLACHRKSFKPIAAAIERSAPSDR
ncbi:MAG: ribonuclease HII [Ancalomicrobiaceae bacterium]|nr:ribonuclease HII [Ancalomicrobiaceae bacterium]